MCRAQVRSWVETAVKARVEGLAVQVLSMDSKAKVPKGRPAINSLGRLTRCYYMEGDGPQAPDHDFPSGCGSVTPAGFLQL